MARSQSKQSKIQPDPAIHPLEPSRYDSANGQTSSRWRRIEPWEYGLFIVAIAIVALLAYPYLPRGICFGDSGDLQLASITFGIMHPPGYPWFTTIGYLISRLPGIAEPFLITLGCLASGLVVMWLCALFQVRLGLHAIAAAAITLLLAAHKRFWFNAISPEVYMPALAFLAGAAYLLLKYARLGRTRDLVACGLCLGICVGSRPTALLTVPFFLIAYLVASRHLKQPSRRRVQGLAIAIGCTLLPMAYSFAYVWVRDKPTIAYNYMEHHNRAHHQLPPSSEGVSAKLQRVIWLITAQQFRPEFGTTWARLRSKLRWMHQDLLYAQPVRLALVSLLILVGTVVCFRRHLVAAWLLVGIGLHSVVFVCIYRIYGQAADLAPLVFASAVLLGASLTPVIPSVLPRRRAIGLLIVAALTVSVVWRMANVPARWSVARGSDASSFLDTLDLATFPQDALVLGGWSHAAAIWYARYTLMDRTDIDILVGEPGQWGGWCRDANDRPVFLVPKVSKCGDGRLEPYRNIWRVVPLRRENDR